MAPFKPTNLDTTDLPAKKKRSTNPKLLDNDNMSLDAINRRKLESSTLSAASTSNLKTTSVQSSRASSSTNPSQQASVEAVGDEDDGVRRNAGRPKNPRFILESTDDDDEESTHPAPEKTRTHKTKTPNHAENKVESREGPAGGNSEEESDDEELSESRTLTHDKLIKIFFRAPAKRMAIKGICLFSPGRQDHICRQSKVPRIYL